MMKHYCNLWSSCRTPFVLAYTSPPGLTTSRVCLRSLLVHWLSHLAVGSCSVWTHMRTALRTQRLETPSLLHRSATISSQWRTNPVSLLLGTWCWRWHTTDQWAAPGWCGEPGHRWTQILSWRQAGWRDLWGAEGWWTTGRCCQYGHY